MPLELLTFLFFFFQQDGSAKKVTPVLDYNFFKERVEPIFLKKRPGHARCVACHATGTPPLEPLLPGATSWDEDQSRKNFAIWKNYVKPGSPTESMMLMHPLAHEAGGDSFHGGGKHWKTQSDPEWQTLADWVRGRTLEGAK